MLFCILDHLILIMDFSNGSIVKNSPANSEDMDLIPGVGSSHGEGNGYPLQYSCLENPMDSGAWWAAVPTVAESNMTERLSMHTHANS